MLFASGRHDTEEHLATQINRCPIGFVLIIRHFFDSGFCLPNALDCSGSEFCPMISWVADHAFWAANNKLSTHFADICRF